MEFLKYSFLFEFNIYFHQLLLPFLFTCRLNCPSDSQILFCSFCQRDKLPDNYYLLGRALFWLTVSVESVHCWLQHRNSMADWHSIVKLFSHHCIQDAARECWVGMRAHPPTSCLDVTWIFGLRLTCEEHIQLLIHQLTNLWIGIASLWSKYLRKTHHWTQDCSGTF